MTTPAPSSQRIVVAVLNTVLAADGGGPVRVSTQKPDPTKHDRFVVLSRIGGGTDFALSRPRFLFECYAAGEVAAEELAMRVDAALSRAAGRSAHGGVVTGWASDHNIVRFDDPDASRHRFQFTGALGIGTVPAAP